MILELIYKMTESKKSLDGFNSRLATAGKKIVKL